MGLSKAQWKRAIWAQLHAHISAAHDQDLFGEDVVDSLPKSVQALFNAAWEEVEAECLRRSK